MDKRNLNRIKHKMEINQKYGKYPTNIIHEKVINIVNDADECEHLGNAQYSSNPRELITINDMELYYKKGWIK